MIKKLSLLLLLFSFVSCSLFSFEKKDKKNSYTPQNTGLQQLEAFYARVSLNTKDFERLVLLNIKNKRRVLYFECGRYRGAQSLPDIAGTVIVKKDDFNFVVKELQSLSNESFKNLDPPDNLRSFFGAGQFFLAVEGENTYKIKTSLSALTAKKTSSLKKAYNIVRRLRSYITNKCGKRFYGI